MKGLDMRYNGETFIEIRNSLVQNWRNNKKWVLYPADKNFVRSHNLQFADNLHKANVFCNQQAIKCRHWRYKPLVDVLRSMNNIYSNEEPIIVSHKYFPFENYHGFIEEIIKNKLIPALIAGEICPVFWKKIINPLSAIHTYHILKIYFPNNRCSYAHSKQIAASCITYAAAVNLFNENISKASLCKRGIKYHILLIGQTKNKLLLSNDAMPLENTGIVLLTAFVNYNKVANSLKIVMVNDPCSPVILKQPMFVRFHRTKTELEFFDNTLCRISPRNDFDYCDVKFFDYTNALCLVKEWQNKWHDEA